MHARIQIFFVEWGGGGVGGVRGIIVFAGKKGGGGPN